MNAAPAHLEAKLRFWEFTVGQIAAAFVGLVAGFVWASYLSPFGGLGAAISGAYLAGLPIAAAFIASQTEFDLWGLVAAVASWRRLEGRFTPGPGVDLRGYLVRADQSASRAHERDALDLNTLWEDA